MNKVVDIKDKKSLQNAAGVLKRGGILVFPTDTVYGIGCLLNEKAIRKLYKIKNRPLNQPTAVLMNGKDIPRKLLSEYNKYPKGRVTIVVDARNLNIKFPDLILKNNKIGVRIPDHPWLEELIDNVGPIVASSANKKGERPPKSFEEVNDEILKKADLVIETHEKLSGKPSSVYDIEENKVIRS